MIPAKQQTLRDRAERRRYGQHLVKVRVPHSEARIPRVLSYHTRAKLRKGARVVITGGYFEGRVGTVTARRSLWRGFSYGVEPIK